MAQKTVLVAFGTRPEAVKLAPVIEELRRRLAVRVCATAQHRDLLDQMLAVLGIRPDHDLDLMKPDQHLADVTRGVLAGLHQLLRRERPDVVLVHGDTSTTFAAALAATYDRIPVAHVEAGLRTGDAAQPFPEEIHRRLTSHLARWHFAPTESARDSLLREGIDAASIHVTGNTVVDALQGLLRRLQSGEIAPELPPAVRPALEARQLVLITAHRRESFGAAFVRICAAIREVAARHPQAAFLFPVHPNPSVLRAAETLLADVPGVHLSPPLDYAAFVDVMRRCTFILTDSGGVQEEAPSLGKPVLVLRDRTERHEGLAAGVARLVGTDTNRIVAEVDRLLTDAGAVTAMSVAANPYGDGKAAKRIAAILGESLCGAASGGERG